MTHFGIIRERKNPPDMRVVLSPQACQKVLNSFPEAQITVEPSAVRVFRDEEYESAGITVDETMEDCEVLIGVKEVPIEALIPDKKYFFFSHTIKKQPYNRDLLRAILSKNIELYDHEVITNAKGIRLVAFGRYAGIVGAYNGIRTYGLKSNKFSIAKAEVLKDKKDLIRELRTVTLPPIKILLTGKGRVGNGAKEILDGMNLREVSVEDYLQKTFEVPVYCQIDVLDYYNRKDGQHLPMQDFFDHPEAYESNFMRFATVSDLYIAGHFYGDGAPYLYTREDVKDSNFKIKVVADVSCDIDGPVATTLRASTISDPVYGYDPLTEEEVPFMNEDAIAVMAVDNLPAELPRDASEGFGDTFVDHVIPAFFNDDKEGILDRARMTTKGKLTARYAYLQDYVDGKE
ncbi:MAG: NAD(P)-dependent oxidoreductase [Muriicola sp.]|nr:NAD(P)-dependent oxidoreductase [Muriicola sp.]